MTKNIPFLSLMTILTAAMVFPAHAEQDRITEAAIRSFYKDAAQAHQLPYDRYVSYLEQNMAADYSGTVATTINIPGQQPIQQTITQTKQEMLATSKRDYEAMHGTKIVNEVVKIEIAADGRSAKVQDRTIFTGMTMGGPSAEKPVFIDGGGPCVDSLILSPEGILQASHSSCIIELGIRQEQSL
jgi:hypothetical protein